MPASPFKLLEAYGPDEKDIFFGRDAEINALYNLLQQTRLVLVYGASGTGKTSLIQAGLPKVFKGTDWFRISVRRRDDINASLREEIARLLPEGSAPDDLQQGIQQLYERRWIPVYLVFDQFEELFTLGKEEQERKQFFQSIQTLLNANLPCKIIFSMREEYIGHLYDYEPLVPSLFDKRFRLEPMKDATVTEVVENICGVNGIQLEKEPPQPAGEKTTAEQIRDQVKEGKQAAYLPYLQIYLHYLYDHALATKPRPVFDNDGIKAVGKLGDVLKKFIENKTSEAQRYFLTLGAPADFAQRLLDEFATGEGTKQACRKTELTETLKADEALVAEALRYFSDTAKLLRADENDVERYEPVHDVVAKQIHELRSVEDKEYKAFLHHLDIAHERWVRDQYATDRLLPEIDLNKVDIYRERLEQKDEYREKWAELVEKSRLNVEAKKRNKKMRNRVLVGITVLALMAMGWALIERGKTQKTLEKLNDTLDIATTEKVAKEHQIELVKLKSDSISKVYNNLIETERQKRIAEYNTFRTEAVAAREAKRYPEALRAYRNALEKADGPREQADIRIAIAETEEEKIKYEFQRYKDIGLAMKAAGDCPAALQYLELAFQSNKHDEAVNAAIKECDPQK